MNEFNFVNVHDTLQANPIEEFHYDRTIGFAIDNFYDSYDVIMIQMKNICFISQRLILHNVGFLNYFHCYGFVFVSSAELKI